MGGPHNKDCSILGGFQIWVPLFWETTISGLWTDYRTFKELKVMFRSAQGAGRMDVASSCDHHGLCRAAGRQRVQNLPFHFLQVLRTIQFGRAFKGERGLEIKGCINPTTVRLPDDQQESFAGSLVPTALTPGVSRKLITFMDS